MPNIDKRDIKKIILHKAYRDGRNYMLVIWAPKRYKVEVVLKRKYQLIPTIFGLNLSGEIFTDCFGINPSSGDKICKPSIKDYFEFGEALKCYKNKNKL